MSLYEDVIVVAEQYMGPAAEQFIARRYKVIIGPDDPRLLVAADIVRLAEAIGIAGAAYMTDPKAAAFKKEVLALLEEKK